MHLCKLTIYDTPLWPRTEIWTPKDNTDKPAQNIKFDLRSVLSIFLATSFWSTHTFYYGSSSIGDRKMMCSDI